MTRPTLRDQWPAHGLMIAPGSPVGLTPAPARKPHPSPGDTWFSEDGDTVYYWTGTEPVTIITIHTKE